MLGHVNFKTVAKEAGKSLKWIRSSVTGFGSNLARNVYTFGLSLIYVSLISSSAKNTNYETNEDNIQCAISQLHYEH